MTGGTATPAQAPVQPPASNAADPGTNLAPPPIASTAAGAPAVDSANPTAAAPTPAAAAAGVGGTTTPTPAPPAAAGAPAFPVDPAYPDLVFHMNGHIDIGTEAMFCMYIQMPMDGKTAIPSAESHYTPGSHHFLVYRTTLKSIPAGEDVSHVCGAPGVTSTKPGQGNGITAAESAQGNNGSYYEAQTPDARRDLPPGVAHVFTPGEILIATAHYLNTTGAAIDSQIEFRLHRMDPNLVKQEAGTFFLLNTSLNIPPHSEVTFTKSCPITKDLNLGLLWSHMHARGYSFRAWTDDPVAMQQLGGDVYDQPGPAGWEEPHLQTYPFDPPVTLHAGSKLMIQCTYQNTSSNTFVFGLSAETAEMCLLHGMYWPRVDSATERCAMGMSMNGTAMPLSGM